MLMCSKTIRNSACFPREIALRVVRGNGSLLCKLLTKLLGFPPGGGHLSTFHGTGTCHFLGVHFSNCYGIIGIFFTIFRHLTELWLSYSGDFS